jgi:tetratricopeptide (TPR) repeat protein
VDSVKAAHEGGHALTMKTLKLIRLAFVGAALAGACFAAQTLPPAHANADKLYQEKSWAEAARAYAEITKAEPSNGRAWYRLGFALGSQGKYREAVGAFERAVEILNGPLAMYGLASANAGAGDKEKALEWLGKAVQAGFDQAQTLSADPAFAALRDDPRFKEFFARISLASAPCRSQPQHKQFDYWVGEWSVTSQGAKVADSSIQRIVGGCVIYENYSQANGYTGKSFNFFDSALKKWRQTWVDAAGNVSEFTGEFRDGAMHYEGEAHLKDGTRVQRRMTVHDLGPDRVRQYSERSTDGGKTWAVAYDFVYERKK